MEIPVGRVGAPRFTGDLALGFFVVFDFALVEAAEEAAAEDLAGARRARQPLKTLAAAEDIAITKYLLVCLRVNCRLSE